MAVYQSNNEGETEFRPPHLHPIHNFFDLISSKINGEMKKQKCIHKFRRFQEKRDRLNHKQESENDERKKAKIQEKINRVDRREKMDLVEFILGKECSEEQKFKREQFVEEYISLNLEDFTALLNNRQSEL